MTYTQMVFDDLPYGSDYYSDEPTWESDGFSDDGSVLSEHSSQLSKHSGGEWTGTESREIQDFNSDEDRAFEERIRRLTKLPNVWCPKRCTFVFPDQPMSSCSDSSIEDSSGESDGGASSRWAVPEPATSNDTLSLHEIIEQQKVEQKEEEERQAFLREQAALREKERGRRFGSRYDQDRRFHGRGRPHHSAHGMDNERRRQAHDGRPPHPDRENDRRRQNGRGSQSLPNRSFSEREREDHSATRNGPRRPTLLVPTTNRQPVTDSQGFVMVSYKKQKRNDARGRPAAPAHPGNPTAAPRANTTQNATDTSHERSGEALCPFPGGHDSQCRLVHRLRDWQPRRCRNASNCPRGESCAFWHTQNETREAYLIRAIRHNVSFFRKQKADYISTYKLRC